MVRMQQILPIAIAWLSHFSGFPLTGSAYGQSTSQPKNNTQILMCGVKHCSAQLTSCLTENSCRGALGCNRRCSQQQTQAEQQACHLVCQLDQGKSSQAYSHLVDCFASNQCLPTMPEGSDGRCPVNDTNRHLVAPLTDLAALEGLWRELRGRNCGVPGSGWEGGYDALPCRTSAWVPNEGEWIYHTSFCAPSPDRQCRQQQPVFLLAQPSFDPKVEGRLEVNYLDPPLKPQEEEWYVLSQPDPDWILYTYCGSTPAGQYAGINMITRTNRSAPPAEVLETFRQDAAQFGVDVDAMCPIEHGRCPSVDPVADVAGAL